jgi:hypothetical protein
MPRSRNAAKPAVGTKPRKLRKKIARKAARSLPGFISLVTNATVVAQSTEFSLAAISFEEALQLAPLFELTAKSSEVDLHSRLRSQLIDAGVITANARVAFDSSKFLVTFTNNGVRGLSRGSLRLMQATAGGKIPVLTNGAGRIVQNARVASQIATKAAAFAAIAVGIAHMISGADLAARLKDVQTDVRFLVAARTNDKLGRIEAIYAYSRELLAGPRSSAVDLEIFRQTKDLVEVRAQWRRDVHSKLQAIEDPTKKSGLLNWLRNRVADGVNKDARHLHSQATAALAELHWIDFSLALQYTLSAATGREAGFLQLTLPDEIRTIEQLGAAVAARTESLKDRNDDCSPLPLLDGINAMRDRYAQFVEPPTLRGSPNVTAHRRHFIA